MTPLRLALRPVRSLHANLGAPGLLLGLFSLLSFAFGLIVLAREMDRLRRTGRDALRPVIAGWVRTLPVDYLGATLVDYVDRWRRARPQERTARLEQLRAALEHLGEVFDRPEIRRTRMIDVLALELGPDEQQKGPPLASWRPRTPRRITPLDHIDHIPVLGLRADSQDPPRIELAVRYRIAPEIESAAAVFAARYRRLVLALLGLSFFPLLCLLYMALQAGALRARAAREAAQEATLDLADRTCHELGNVAFVLANERRNLADHLAVMERFVAEEPAAVAAACRRMGAGSAYAEGFLGALAREQADRGLDREIELQASLRIVRDVCRQIAICSDYIALTIRELDSYLKQSSLPLHLAPAAVAACLDDALALLGPRLEAAGVRIERAIAPTAWVVADRRLLVHALVNLLKNALEAFRAAGPDAVVRIEARAESAAVVLLVSDNGPGVAAEDRELLFADGFTTKGPGRGKGLAIVRDTIVAQHGQIEVESQPGCGTTFRIRLAAAPAPAGCEVESRAGGR